jgi:hypothetical protein
MPAMSGLVGVFLLQRAFQANPDALRECPIDIAEMRTETQHLPAAASVATCVDESLECAT